MTSFIAWLAADRSRKSGLYFASDSRVSFEDGTLRDNCIKLFCPTASPEIFGMLGSNIAFPQAALPQICAEIDQHRIPLGEATSMYGRMAWVENRLKAMKQSFPSEGSFSIFHGSRNGYDAGSNFALNRLSFVSDSEPWVVEEYNLNHDESHSIVFDGSGHEGVWDKVWPLTTSVGSVSRVHFEGFCKALTPPCTDPKSGGAPQLLGLGSAGMGRHYGVKTAQGLYYQGRPASFTSVPDKTQWRDETFQPIGPSGTLMKNRRRKLIKGSKRPPKQT